MNEPKIESGLQLFARIKESENNQILKFPILPKGLRPRELVEIVGKHGVGKSSFLLDFIVNSILPQSYNDIHLPGNNIHVMVINTSHQFNIGNIANLLEYRLKQYLKIIPSISVIEDCLEKVTILNSYNNEQLKFTFLNLEYILQENKHVKLIAMDSLCTYYWIDRIDLGCVSYKSYCSTVRNSLENVVNNFNLIGIYTKIETNPVPRISSAGIDYSVHLNKIKSDYEVNIFQQDQIISKLKYTLTPFINIH